MKSLSKRILVFSFAVWCLLVVFSSSTILYAVEGTPVTQGVQGIQGQQLQKSLPAIIKANPSMISALKYPNLPPEFNAARSRLDNAYNGLQKYLPKLSEAYGKYTSKRDECINKAYTYDDQKSAGCLPIDSVDICIGKLVGKCSGTEFGIFVNEAWAVNTFLVNILYDGDVMKSELQKLNDYAKCLRYQWPQQTCQ